MKLRITQLLVIGIPILIYEIAVRLQWIDSFTFLPFSTMVINAVMLFFDAQFFTESILDTTIKVLLSFIVSAVLGIIIGILMWRSDLMYHITQPYLMVFYAIPVFAIYPVFIIIFGYGIVPVVIIGVMFS